MRCRHQGSTCPGKNHQQTYSSTEPYCLLTSLPSTPVKMFHPVLFERFVFVYYSLIETPPIMTSSIITLNLVCRDVMTYNMFMSSHTRDSGNHQCLCCSEKFSHKFFISTFNPEILVSAASRHTHTHAHTLMFIYIHKYNLCENINMLEV